MNRLNLENGVKTNVWLNEKLAEGRCNGSKIIKNIMIENLLEANRNEKA